MVKWTVACSISRTKTEALACFCCQFVAVDSDWPLCATPGEVNVPILCIVLNRSDSVVQDVLEILNLPTSGPFG